MNQPKFSLAIADDVGVDGEADELEEEEDTEQTPAVTTTNEVDGEASEEDDEEGSQPAPNKNPTENAPVPQESLSKTGSSKNFSELAAPKSEAEKKLREANEVLRADLATKLDRAYSSTDRGLKISAASISETLVTTKSVVSHIVGFREAMEYLSESSERLAIPMRLN